MGQHGSHTDADSDGSSSDAQSPPAHGRAPGIQAGAAHIQPNPISLRGPGQIGPQLAGMPAGLAAPVSAPTRVPARPSPVAGSFPYPVPAAVRWPAHLPMPGVPPCVPGCRDAPRDSAWFDDFFRFIWPNLSHYVGERLKTSVSKMSLSMKATFPPSFWRGVDKFADNLAQQPLTLPLQTPWLNGFIADIWALLSPNFKQLVEDIVIPKVQAKLPKALGSFHVDPCALGGAQPRITDIRAEPRTEGRPYIDITMGLEWKSDVDISVHFPADVIKAGITGIHLSAEVHVCLLELLDAPPFVGGVNVWMVNPPKFSLDWTGILGFLDSHMFEAIIHKEFNKIFDKMLVLPNRFGFAVAEGLDIFRVLRPPPKGLLRLEVNRASGLRCDDFNASTLWSGRRTSDPYVLAELGASQWRTTTVWESPGEAEWNEAHYFLVDEPFDQYVNFTVFDEDKLSADDLLARRRHVGLPELLGCSPADQHAFGRERSHRQSLKLEALWAEKAQAGEGAQPEERGSGVIGKIRSATSHTTQWLAHEIDRHTGADAEEWEKLDGQLELTATWRPFELSSGVASLYRPEAYSQEHVTAMLFVGIDTCYRLPHQADLNTVYWAEIQCTPFVSEDDEDITEGEPRQKTSQRKKPKTAKKREIWDPEEKQEELVRKVALLLQNGIPNDVIMATLEITQAQLDASLEHAYHDPTLEHVDIAWQQGFTFLLADPRQSTVTIEVFKKDKEDISMGTFTYPVAQLLRCKRFADRQERTPLVGESPEVSLSATFQLHPLFMKDLPPSTRLARACSDDAAEAPASMGRAKPPKQRVVYLDRMGRKRTQVGGIWLEEKDDDDAAAAGTTVGEKVHHAVEAGEAFIDRMLHGAKDHPHEDAKSGTRAGGPS